MEIKDLNNVVITRSSSGESVAEKPSLEQPTLMRRLAVSLLDLLLTSLIRALVAIPLSLWLLKEKLKLIRGFANKHPHVSNLETLGYFNEIGFLENFSIFLVLVILAGGVYHIVLNTFFFRSTVGGRVMGVRVVNYPDYGKPLTLPQACLRYVCSLVPIFTPALLYGMFLGTGITPVFVVIFICFLFWYEVSFFSDVKRSAHDLISGTVVARIGEEGEVLLCKGKKGFFSKLWQF